MESNVIYNFTVATTAIFPFLSFIGNLLVLVVFLRKKLRDLSMSRYLCALAIADVFEVVTSCMINCTSIVDFADLYCKLIIFFTASYFTFCTFMRMVISIDRYAFIRFSKQYQFRNSVIFQLSVILVVVLIGFAQGTPYFYLYGKINFENETIAYCTNQNGTESMILNILNVAVSVMLPFIGMVTCSFIVWKMLRDSKKKFSEKNNNQIQLLKAMLGCDIFFFICNMPVTLYLLAVTFLPETYDPMIYIFLNIFSLFNNTFSFIVYFLSNNLFREEVFKMMGKKSKYAETLSTCQAKSTIK